MQYSFDLPDVQKPVYDKELTTKAIEDVFERYRYFKTVEFEEVEAKITNSYEERFHGPTGITSDPTANIAIRNVDEPTARLMFINRVERVVNRLPTLEQKIIKLRYMADDYVYDYQVYRIDLGISAETYKKRRWKAFERLAGMLKVGVLRQKGDEGGGSSRTAGNRLGQISDDASTETHTRNNENESKEDV